VDKDRIKGSAEQAKGAVKETAGKVFGDKKLETEGKTEKAAGKVQIGALVGGNGGRFYFDASPSSFFKASSIARRE
jgi:uncharacterized protein YjbJ (UPF0337 family)